MRIAVLMLNLGGPARLRDVKPFLRNLFSDRDTIRFPGGRLGQRFFARLISMRRARLSRLEPTSICLRHPTETAR